MTTKQEAKKVAKERAESIVDERIVPYTLDNIAEWTGEIMGKLTTLEAEGDHAEISEIIHDILVRETIAQLEKTLNKK